ncbi:TetR/AcrR family transcriptional regulator [Vallitalea guaymasensis]|uniref:TetR/AcrR family transcriptional regulator n=1 Tax=Vallitalea guaymasensis TaxID=1185412 RepID=A0A8J8SAC0_9FIRM|nr:TetR/AcrR family transcriptional regulator [Vallitalea guaymasensis]QUH27608.1 TetR/AcrR family transcriptional regulator [Vallitalea guaymasensis]
MRVDELYTDEKLDKRDMTRNRIVNASLELFLSDGFRDTTMARIAKESGISRKTLYEYFKSKEEITTIIDMCLIREYNRIMEEAMPKLCGNGYNKLKQYFSIIDNNIDNFKDTIMFTGIYDYNVKTNEINSSLRDEFYDTIKQATGYLTEILKQGIEDGSIKDYIDPHLTANTIGDSWLSLAQRVFRRHKSLDMSEEECRKMITLQLSLFLEGLKA